MKQWLGPVCVSAWILLFTPQKRENSLFFYFNHLGSKRRVDHDVSKYQRTSQYYSQDPRASHKIIDSTTKVFPMLFIYLFFYFTEYFYTNPFWIMWKGLAFSPSPVLAVSSYCTLSPAQSFCLCCTVNNFQSCSASWLSCRPEKRLSGICWKAALFVNTIWRMWTTFAQLLSFFFFLLQPSQGK